MAWGLGSWGISGWGIGGFEVNSQNPADGATNVNRNPTISFVLSSANAIINLATINVSANGIQLITNGVFTDNAIGTINNSDPHNVIVNIITTFFFDVLTKVTVIVDAVDAANETPPDNNTWSFTTNNVAQTFNMSIMRGFERVATAGSTFNPLDPPGGVGAQTGG